MPTLTNVQTSSNLLPPVITIDGPSGTGKGTVSKLIAKTLGWHYLDSGAIYRMLAYAALQKNIATDDESQLQHLASNLDLQFLEVQGRNHLFLDGIDITKNIRSELCGNIASKISVIPSVRQALLDKQRAFRQFPGLVADGRDMGTVIFPDAQCKFFLFAHTKERAVRRHNQLKKAGIHASLDAVFCDLEQRDLRDSQRKAAPLKPAMDAIIIDTTTLSVRKVYGQVMQRIKHYVHCTTARL